MYFVCIMLGNSPQVHYFQRRVDWCSEELRSWASRIYKCLQSQGQGHVKNGLPLYQVLLLALYRCQDDSTLFFSSSDPLWQYIKVKVIGVSMYTMCKSTMMPSLNAILKYCPRYDNYHTSYTFVELWLWVNIDVVSWMNSAYRENENGVSWVVCLCIHVHKGNKQNKNFSGLRCIHQRKRERTAASYLFERWICLFAWLSQCLWAKLYPRCRLVWLIYVICYVSETCLTSCLNDVKQLHLSCLVAKRAWKAGTDENAYLCQLKEMLVWP